MPNETIKLYAQSECLLFAGPEDTYYIVNQNEFIGAFSRERHSGEWFMRLGPEVLASHVFIAKAWQSLLDEIDRYAS